MSLLNSGPFCAKKLFFPRANALGNFNEIFIMVPHFGWSSVACGLKLSRSQWAAIKELVRISSPRDENNSAKPRFWMSVAREKPLRPKVSAQVWFIPLHINETTKYKFMMLKIGWNNQNEKLLKIPWHTPTTFQQFFHWMKSPRTSGLSPKSE